MRRRLTTWIAACVVLLHALAPGIHAVQLRVEQQRDQVVRRCCMSGTLLGGGAGRTPTHDRQHAQLLTCAIGSWLAHEHGYTPRWVLLPRQQHERGEAVAATPPRPVERRRPRTPPARGPPA
ncbi:MAG: DUF2946 family protein [Planctomycetota bacterium]